MGTVIWRLIYAYPLTVELLLYAFDKPDGWQVPNVLYSQVKQRTRNLDVPEQVR